MNSASQVILETIDSQALRDNPLGDPSRRVVPVYLPPGYSGSNQAYPCVYFLSGFSSRGLGLLNDSLWDENLPQRLDRLIQSNRIRPLIAVMPDCSTRYGGSQYLNSSATGRYADHLLEVVEFIDHRYRTRADRDYRAITGISSGGYGAMIMGMRRPDVFGLVADHSGDKYFELCYKPDFPGFLRYYERVGMEGLRQLMENPAGIRPRRGDFFPAINTLAMSSCYSPNPGNPLGFDLPVNPETGELDRAVWARWEAHDPVYLVNQYAEALSSLRLLYIECGKLDEYNLQYGARIFAQKLAQQGIPFIQTEFEDGHRSLGYRYDESLILISDSMP
jgi:enterochelin esterase family protein